jgi:hypothetical protein
MGDKDRSSQENILAVQLPPRDHPFEEIVAAIQRHAALGRMCYQKYTCSGCGLRLSMEEPNVLYKTGRCDGCGVVTDIEKQGCNYMLHIAGAENTEAFLKGGMK